MTALAVAELQLEPADRAELEWLLRPHDHELDVYYDDTDVTGSVYHANYLRFFGRARMALLGGTALVALQQRSGARFVVHKVELVFRSPARFGDRLRIRSQLQLASWHKLDFEQVASHAGDGRTVATAGLRVVCVDPRGQPLPIPVAELVRVRRELGIAAAGSSYR